MFSVLVCLKPVCRSFPLVILFFRDSRKCVSGNFAGLGNKKEKVLWSDVQEKSTEQYSESECQKTPVLMDEISENILNEKAQPAVPNANSTVYNLIPKDHSCRKLLNRQIKPTVREYACSEVEMKNRLHQNASQQVAEKLENREDAATKKKMTKVKWMFHAARSWISNCEFLTWIFQDPDSPSSFGSAHVSHQTLFPSNSKKPSRETRMQRKTREDILIANLPDEYLKNHEQFKKFGSIIVQKREAIEKSASEKPLQPSPLRCLPGKAWEKVWTIEIVSTLWFTSKWHDKSESSLPRDACGKIPLTTRDFRAGLEQRTPHARCSGSRKSKQPSGWMTSPFNSYGSKISLTAKNWIWWWHQCWWFKDHMDCPVF